VENVKYEDKALTTEATCHHRRDILAHCCLLRDKYAAAQHLTQAYCMTEQAQQPLAGECPLVVGADDCTGSPEIPSLHLVAGQFDRSRP